MKIELHPSLAEFDALTNDEMDKLRKGIKESGCLMPLLLWERAPGVYCLMDGRHRYLICQELGVRFNTHTFKGSEQAAIALGRSLNEARRHRPLGVRAMDAAEEATAPEGRPKETLSLDRVSVEEAAERHNVSVPTVSRAKVVFEHGTEELQEAVREGVVSVRDAATVAKEKPAVQAKAVKAVKEGKAPTAKAAADQVKESGEICDDDGNTVPAKLRPVFAEVFLFNSAAARLAKAAESLVKIEESPFYKSEGERKYSTSCRTAEKKMLGLRPARVCCGDGCEKCDGKGFFTTEEIDNAPVD